VTFGPSRDELYSHDHIFGVIDRPSHLVVETTESRPDGSVVEFEIEFIFGARGGKTLMTMIQRSLPTVELRDEHRAGVPDAFARLEQAREESSRLTQGHPS
jgi:Activator of Hsp90 ATPase homolog 1-like protein